MGVSHIDEPPGPDDPLYNGVWFVFWRLSTRFAGDKSEEPSSNALPVIGRGVPGPDQPSAKSQT